MDVGSVELLEALVRSRLDDLRGAIRSDEPLRGGSLFPLLTRLVDAFDKERSDATRALGNANVQEREALGRKLLRCTQKLDTVHLIAADYSPDAGRQDVPVGLLCLIDTLIADLLPEGADALVHLDASRMYSTLSLTQFASEMLNDKSVAQGPGLLVFNLPALDPANVLLAPILAHEVGHNLVTRSDLVNELYQNADLVPLNDAFNRCLQKDPTAEPKEWKNALNSWLAELLCDAVAVALCGPSFLYAAAAFLPAPNPGTLGSHPYPADRLSLTMSQLESLGWQPYLDLESPNICAWMKGLSGSSLIVPPMGEFLRDAIGILANSIESVAHSHVVNRLGPFSYSAISEELREFLDAGIPPSRLGNGIPTPWQLVLAGWEVSLHSHRDEPRALGSAVADRRFNEFLVKGLELIRVTQLWDEVLTRC